MLSVRRRRAHLTDRTRATIRGFARVSTGRSGRARRCSAALRQPPARAAYRSQRQGGQSGLAHASHARKIDPERARKSHDRSSLMSVQKALVIGGGISGLVAGAAMARRGIDVDLVEIKDKLGDEGGIGLSIMGNASKALATIGAAHIYVANDLPVDVFTG